MEDLSAILGDLLSGGDSLEQLRSVIAAAGLGQSPAPAAADSAEPAKSEPPAAEPASSPAIDFSSLLGMLGGMGAPAADASGSPDLSALLGMLGGGKSSAPPPPSSAGIDPAMLGKIMQILGALNQSDRNTELLRALAPFAATTARSGWRKPRRLCALSSSCRCWAAVKRRSSHGAVESRG